jgi:hypothetical protein
MPPPQLLEVARGLRHLLIPTAQESFPLKEGGEPRFRREVNEGDVFRDALGYPRCFG